MTRQLLRWLAHQARWWLTPTYCRPEQRHNTWWPFIVERNYEALRRNVALRRLLAPFWAEAERSHRAMTLIAALSPDVAGVTTITVPRLSPKITEEPTA